MDEPTRPYSTHDHDEARGAVPPPRPRPDALGDELAAARPTRPAPADPPAPDQAEPTAVQAEPLPDPDAGPHHGFPDEEPGAREQAGERVREQAAAAQQELRLAQEELARRAARIGIGLPELLAAGTFAAFTAFLILVLDLAIPAWLAALLVTLAYGLVAIRLLRRPPRGRGGAGSRG